VRHRLRRLPRTSGESLLPLGRHSFRRWESKPCHRSSAPRRYRLRSRGAATGHALSVWPCGRCSWRAIARLQSGISDSSPLDRGEQQRRERSAGRATPDRERRAIGRFRCGRQLIQLLRGILARRGRRPAVGPMSGGAEPGPACYGGAAINPVTDASVLLGYLNPRASAGGSLWLDAVPPRRRVRSAADRLDLSVTATAAETPPSR